ncbi:hypothetical protein PSCICJ_22100 [Pseudomonas cichorii]|uniref:hypothetical protein n=1 Tax=Pseudomonas cichorii TaxID=36746 RepID=UPI001910151C|nr:hypothetical protein [Pseudomonas cichorii]GFM66092.1 hypothetical protein PSCICJ_22100 [Pseudomonas cichorii]
MKNRFEIALDQDEITDFFKGNGIYFARGSDWGDHLYISNWQVMCGILKTQKPAQSLLTNLFEEYLRYLGDSYKDAESLLFNISAYYGLKRKLPFLSADNYDLLDSLDEKSKHIVGQTFRRLRKEYDLENKDLPATAFDQLIERIRKNGCNISLEDL